MPKQIIIPFGPQHPVLPEPIHLDLVLEDEKVVEALPSIGYIHRGLEKLVEKRLTHLQQGKMPDILTALVILIILHMRLERVV